MAADEKGKDRLERIMVTISHELMHRRQMVLQTTFDQSLSLEEKNKFLDEIRMMGERQMAYGEKEKKQMELAGFVKQAEDTRVRMASIEMDVQAHYAGNNRRGEPAMTKSQKHAHDQMAQSLETVRRQIEQTVAIIEYWDSVIAGKPEAPNVPAPGV